MIPAGKRDRYTLALERYQNPQHVKLGGFEPWYITVYRRGRYLLLAKLKNHVYVHFLRHRTKYADPWCEAFGVGGRTGASHCGWAAKACTP